MQALLARVGWLVGATAVVAVVAVCVTLAPIRLFG